MNSFLYQLTRELYSRYGHELSDCWVVFPNRRAGLFFSKYLNQLLDGPMWSPKIFTINELIREWSSLMVEDNLGVLFRLFKKFNQKRESSESFDEFYYWGEMLLSDFDDIDKYRVNARDLFKNLASIKEIEGLFDYLDEEQIEAIRNFWQSFDPSHISAHQHDFISVWQVLFEIYSELREELREEGVAYEGMAYRDVVEKMEAGELGVEAGKLIFVGFNALNRCEEDLFRFLQQKNKAEFYWDYDESYLIDSYHEAGLFMRDNLKRFPSPKTKISFSQLYNSDKDVEFVALSSDVGQAKYAHAAVEEFFEEKRGVAEETAIVLADEELLLPVLHSIPKIVNDVNVTMGYPAKNTPVASLLRLIVELQKGGRVLKDGFHFYYKNVLALLNHQYLNSLYNEAVGELIHQILTTNKIYLKPSEFKGIPLMDNIFREVDSVEDISDYLLELLQSVFESLDKEGNQKSIVERMEQEYVYNLFLAVKRLNSLLDEHRIELRLDTYYRLLDKMVQSLTIPFVGEPLAGLQVMGILETRLLDFKKIVVLSMNEGKLPKAGVANSFIPYSLRKGFGMPTIDHQDAIFGYYFYRLLQRAEQIKLVYSTKSDGIRSGEMSRFLYQLKYESDFIIREINPGYDISLPSRKEIRVNKNERIISALRSYCKGGSRSFSPSALNTYLGCSLRFYFKYLGGLTEPDQITEEIDSPMFGNLFHCAMERLYEPYHGKMINKEILDQIVNDKLLVDKCLTESFQINYFKTETPVSITGRNRLIYDILKKYINQMLVLDKRFTPFEIVKLEGRYRINIPINGESVQISGFIDRIDRVGETIRIIDYKTGKANTRFKSISSLFERNGKNRNGAAFQTFLYCLFFEDSAPSSYLVSPGVYSLKEIFNDSFSCELVMKNGHEKGVVVNDYRPFKLEFVDELKSLLNEIYDPKVPFEQVEDEKECRNCPYIEICHRGA